MNRRNEFIRNRTFDIFEGQKELEIFAEENKVPIISKESLDFLISVIKIKKPKKIIEFGTAIGYSAICMAYQYDSLDIISFERNTKMYNLAIDNIKKHNLESRIKVFNVDISESKDYFKNEIFDLAFIDAAKGQYKLFFELVYDNIDKDGIIISDNLFCKDIVLEKDIKQVDKRYRTIYKRMNDYIDFLKKENKEHFTSILPIGDGVSITYKNM